MPSPLTQSTAGCQPVHKPKENKIPPQANAEENHGTEKDARSEGNQHLLDDLEEQIRPRFVEPTVTFPESRRQRNWNWNNLKSWERY